MREIKFRAWDKEEEMMLNDVSLQNETWDMMNELFGNEDSLSFMQYTGLKDTNGVEIYEGDILYFEPYETHGNDRVVEYIDGAYRGRLIRNGYSELLAECVYETKVIGNIYENPELLEREAE